MAKSLQTILHEVIDLLVEAETSAHVWLDDPGNGGWNPGTIEPGGYASTYIDVNGAEISDFVMVSSEWEGWDLNPQLIITSWVIRPNAVHIGVKNEGSTPVTITESRWHARVMKR